MKSLALTALFIASLCGQVQPPPKLTPGTPAPAVQTPPAAQSASISPDTVVVEVAGKKYTKADVDSMIAALPLPYQQAVRSNPQQLSQIFAMKQLADDAQKSGLDKQSPLKESLEFNRLNILAQAQLTSYQNMIPVDKATLEKYYQENPERFKQAKVRVIQVMFSPMPDKMGADGKKMLGEAEAKAKIEDLRKQLSAGADFAKLAAENSEDKTSAGKGGDFGIIKRNSPYPDPIKNAVFALKPGGLSEPVKQPTSFYLVRVDEVSVEPYDEASTEITQILRTERFSQYVKGIQDQYKVKVENPAYFSPQAATQLQQVHQ
jgi:peptidyl-prolyl cis-trans isomerase C